MLKSRICLIVPGAAAKPNPKMGQALGPLGINMAQFCKELNEKTAEYRSDVPLRVKLDAYTDRTYKYKIKPPPTSWFIKKISGLEKLGKFPKHQLVGKVPIQYIYEIAKIKREMDPDLKKLSLEMICKMIIGQCSSMGIVVGPGNPDEKPNPIKITIK